MKSMPSFRDYDNPKRKHPYGWDFGHGKNRKYRTFRTKKDKITFRIEYEKKFFSDRDAFINFDADKWRRFLECERLAGNMDALESAARQSGDFIKGVNMDFKEASAMKLSDLKRIESVNFKRVETYCERFIAAKGNRALDHYSHTDCQGWIDELSKEHGLNSLKNHHKAIASVFNLAVRLGYLNKSPAQYITFPSGRGEKRTTIFEPKEVQKLLDYLWHENRPLAGVYAILFFIGLRISMIAPSPEKRAKGEFIRMDMINIRDREIIIPEGIMKKENELIIDNDRAPANLWPWLEQIHEARIPEPAQTFNKRRLVFCRKLNITWSPNGHRRSCASYYAALKGRSSASDLLGNTEKMIVKHYQVSTFKNKAKSYFSILPK